MILTGLITGAVVLLGMIAFFLLVYRAYMREKLSLLITLRAYFESADEKTPSEFALLVDQIADKFSHKAIDLAKTTFMGMQSVDSKNMARIEGDIMQDTMAQQNPMIGALLSQYPTLARRLQKNPQLMPLVQGLLGKITAGAPKKNGGEKQLESPQIDMFRS